MGAQQSGMGSKGVKLRRRSNAAGAVTDYELSEAGVDLAKAVAQYQRKDTGVPKLTSSTSIAGAAASTLNTTASVAAGGGAQGGSASPAQSGGTAAAQAAAADQRRRTAARAAAAAPAQVEMPPWEIVANLSEADWVALRAWIEAGWRCRKCSHIRDDFAEHPKAMSLLKKCGIVPPKGNRASATSGGSSPSLSTSSQKTSTTGVRMIEYASASPDHQVGYLSDSSARSSRSSSPTRMASAPQLSEASPRFHNDCTGAHSPFEDTNQSAPLGPDACPHLAGGYPGLGGPPSFGSGSESFREGGSGVQKSIGGGAPSGMPPSMPLSRTVSGAESVLQKKILAAITRAHQVYFIDKEPNGSLVFDYLLSALLDVTNASFGFISSALLKADGSPYLKTHAMSNLAWTKELRAWYAANAHKGLVFTNMNTLHGSVVLTGHSVITNDARSDPRARGVPPGHPQIENFLGLPLFTGPELIGMYGLANSTDGFSEHLAKELEPLTMTVAQMIYAVNERKRRKEAELHLSSVVQVAKEGILSLSHSGHVTSMNFSARVMFGFNTAEEEATLGKDEIPPPANLQFQQMLLEIDNRQDFLVHGLEHHTGHVHTGTGKRIDGATFPLEISISKGTYDTVFYVAVIRDVTERIEHEKRLKESDQRWEYAITGSDGGVWEWDMAHHTLFVSSHWKEMLGYAEGDIGSSIEDWDRLLHPDDREAAYADLKEHLDGFTPLYHNEHRLRCKDGAYKWFEHRGKVVGRTEEGEPELFVSTHSDISEKRSFEAKVEAIKYSVAKAEQMNAGILAMIVHDIEPPAQEVVRHATKLLEGAVELPIDVRENAAAVRDCGERLLRAVNEKTDLGAILAGKVKLESNPFNVVQVLETAAGLLEMNAEAVGSELVIEVAEGIPPLIMGDASRVLQVFVSLLSVVIHGLTEGGMLLRAQLRCELVPPPPHMAMAGPQQMVLLVVFRDHTMADDCDTLKLVRQLVALMGGHVSIDDGLGDEGHPASVSVALPAKLAHSVDKIVQLWAGPAPEIPEDVKKTRALVVGAGKVLLSLLDQQLVQWGVHHSTVLCSPQEAFLHLLPTGALPPVTSAPASSIRPAASARKDGGLARDYDVVIIDVSSCQSPGSLLSDMGMQGVIDLLGKEKVGVVLVVSAMQAKPGGGGKTSAPGGGWGLGMSDGGLSEVEAAVKSARSWAGRTPIIVKKPMVRPGALLRAFMDAVAVVTGGAEDGSSFAGAAGLGPSAAHLRSGSSMGGPSVPGDSLSLGSLPSDSLRLSGRVLFAEDNPVNRKVGAAIIAATGAMVELASNGMEAVALYQSKPFNLIILDCQMPEVDGWQASRKIRDIESLRAQPRVAIIGLANNPLKGDREKCLAAGMSDFIAKPVTKSALELVLRRILVQA